ncbi:TPA: hypothetical protein QCX20_002337 [Bacillus toyonensis]|uniref:DUF5915 domain-containing protein n=1 Tax=Bacillus toyonensis TaxID=155322 RepID=UPI0021D2AA5F|nr:DUF5915 domain-containing protein [Bacillus toyonensis]MCU5726181.1 DUF5915 domain-containing protein [Bacillus toyonensis]HDR7428994.1 hypothetical protein [Bacillus toyonensis]
MYGDKVLLTFSIEFGCFFIFSKKVLSWILVMRRKTELSVKKGIVRDFIRGVQELRKKMDLPVGKRIELYVSCS